MKQTFVLGIFLSIFSFNVIAQDCEAYIPTKEGEKYTYVSKNKKGKAESYYSQELLNKSNVDGGTKFEILNVNYDKDRKMTSEDTLEFFCKGNMFYMDMSHFLNKEQLGAYEESDIEITFENIGYPTDLKPGSELNDGFIQALINAGMPITFKTDITNRKVLGTEEITTEAGTFNTVKVSEDISSKLGFVTVKMSTVSWIKMNIGNIKSETYDKNGNLISSSELISIE